MDTVVLAEAGAAVVGVGAAEVAGELDFELLEHAVNAITATTIAPHRLCRRTDALLPRVSGPGTVPFVDALALVRTIG